jgi:hypothetical protein
VLGDELIDHVGGVTAPLEGPALTRRSRAVGTQPLLAPGRWAGITHRVVSASRSPSLTSGSGVRRGSLPLPPSAPHTERGGADG